MVIKLVITGNIASGKTTVEKILKKLGVKTFCADTFCHFLMENDEKVKGKIEKLFSGLIKKEPDRRKMREVVFNDKKKKEELERILHPLVFKEIKRFYKENKDEKLAAAIVPLLFETKSEGLFDKILLVCADEKIRFNRIKKRNKLEEELIRKIILSQIPQEEKFKKADFIINNDNKSKKEMEKEIKKIIEELR